MDQVLPEEEWLEKEARRELQVFYDQEFEKRAEPLIERAAVAVYGEEETVIKHRGKANLARASRLKLSRALTQSFAKAVRDGYSTGICVLTDDPDERVGVATAPVVMAAVAPNKKAWSCALIVLAKTARSIS